MFHLLYLVFLRTLDFRAPLVLRFVNLDFLLMLCLDSGGLLVSCLCELRSYQVLDWVGGGQCDGLRWLCVCGLGWAFFVSFLIGGFCW